ncbi:hypothetical protein BGX26_006782, partial [Mortierella sp. AD094]
SSTEAVSGSLTEKAVDSSLTLHHSVSTLTVFPLPACRVGIGAFIRMCDKRSVFKDGTVIASGWVVILQSTSPSNLSTSPPPGSPPDRDDKRGDRSSKPTNSKKSQQKPG